MCEAMCIGAVGQQAVHYVYLVVVVVLYCYILLVVPAVHQQERCASHHALNDDSIHIALTYLQGALCHAAHLCTALRIDTILCSRDICYAQAHSHLTATYAFGITTNVCQAIIMFCLK